MLQFVVIFFNDIFSCVFLYYITNHRYRYCSAIPNQPCVQSRVILALVKTQVRCVYHSYKKSKAFYPNKTDERRLLT